MSNKTYARAQMFLMEFIAVILFFALCAAICLSAFVKADQMSQESSSLSRALLVAQSGAETIKAGEAIPFGETVTYEEAGFHVEIEAVLEDEMLTATIGVYETLEEDRPIVLLEVKKFTPEEVAHE